MTKDAIQRLRQIKDLFLVHTTVPAKDNWKNLDDDAIWQNVVTQVMVVGGSRPVEERFKKSKELQDRISYSTLKQFSTEQERLHVINSVLRNAGIRYASKNISKCRKTNAIEHNFQVVGQEGGPRAFMERISRIEGDRQRIGYVMRNLDYFKSKSTRDFLMEHGFVQEALALDTRVMNILDKLGVKVDSRIRTNEKIYAEVEQRILSMLCKPLGMKGIEFDRMLYQNYGHILETWNGC